MGWHATKKASKLPDMDKSKILVFDVETTGLEPSIDEIIQITILDGYGSELFSSYIKPVRHKIWTEAQRINGIRYDMVKSAPTFRKVRREIQEIFNNAQLVVGYKVGFDIGFVEAAGIVVSGKRFDVMTAFRSYRSGIEKMPHPNCSLKKCASYFNYSFSPHDSSEDAKATLYCFNSMISDVRFTTYKRREKKELRDVYPVEKKKIMLSIAFNDGFFHAIFWRLVIVLAGIALISRLSGIVPRDIDSVKALVDYVKNNLRNEPIVLIASIVVALGTLTIIIRILQKVLLIPKWIVIHIQRLFRTISEFF